MTALREMWEQIPGGHKWLGYFPIYEEVFGHLKKPRVLEIGVYKGASLELWRRYFGSRIVGIDIDPDCARFDSEETPVRIGSQSDPVFLQSVVDEFGPFDLIIDDGGHFSSHQIASFNCLFDALTDDGIYFVEDCETAYWHHTGQRDQAVSFIDFARYLVDLMHDPYMRHDYYFFAKGDGLVAPLITTQISQIRFYDSIVVVYRDQMPPPEVRHL